MPNLSTNQVIDIDIALDPSAALRVARRAAARALSRARAACASDSAEEIAADAVALLLEKNMPLHARSVFSTVKHLAQRAACRFASGRDGTTVPLPEEDDAPGGLDCSAQEEGAAAPAETFSRTFADGSMAWLAGAFCEADIIDLTLSRPDGSTLRGRAALEAAHRLLIEERHGAAGSRHARYARRAVESLPRDAQLLAVSGLPWQEALAQLAHLGIHISRDGLRSGQRAARLRCMGLTAHDAARFSKAHPGRGAHTGARA